MCNFKWLKLKHLQYSVHKPTKKWDYWSEYTNFRSLSLKNNHGCIPEYPTVKNQNILNEYPDLFQGLGCIRVNTQSRWTKIFLQWCIHLEKYQTVSLKDKIKDELDRMEQTGVIVRQTEPTAWVKRMVAVVKPNKIPICIDPRDLNKAIQREH